MHPALSLSPLLSVKGRLYIFAIFVLFAFPLAMNALHVHFQNKAYFSFEGTEGPFASRPVIGSDGHVGYATGAPVSKVEAGGTFTYINNIKIESGMRVCTDYSFVRLSDDIDIRPERKCTVPPALYTLGTATYWWTAPIDATPGHYELRRLMTFITPNGSTKSLLLPSVPIEVTAGPNTSCASHPATSPN